MAISSSSSSSSSDNKVQNCSKQCLESFKCLQKNYDTEREKHNKAKLEIRGYEIALESLEARILGHEKNELAWGERYEFQNYDLKCREIKINNLNLELENVVRSSDEESTLANNRFTKANEYHAVPLPLTGNPLTPRVDISFARLDEYAFRNKIIESKTTETNKTAGTTNEASIVKPKSVNETVVSKSKINRDEVIIEDWTSDMRMMCVLTKLTGHLIKDCDFYDQKSPEPRVKNVVNTEKRVVKPVWDYGKRGNLEILLQDHAVVDSGCSSHMTGNKAYLSDYEYFNGGFVAFGNELFKLLMKVKFSLRALERWCEYSLDLKNIVPSGGRKKSDCQTDENKYGKDELEMMVLNGCFNNMDNTIAVSPIPTLKIHKDHPKGQILGDPTTAVQTRGKIQKASSAQQALISYIHRQNRTNHKDLQKMFVGCFLSQEEPKTISQALKDESWVEAMQEELLQFKLQQVWVLTDLPFGKKAIGTKWVFRNKRDKRSIVVKNKARLVAQGHRQEEGIDYDKVFAPVARKDAEQVKQQTDGNLISKDNEDGVEVDVGEYRSMIGSLMYLTASRPDIMFVVCACARLQVTLKASHLHAVKRIFRYLKHQPKLGLWYLRDSLFELEAFSDGNYSGASLDRKSTTGRCQFLGRRLIS
ncbi:putative ribonuclease H-like domain-containing protein [Tanacetum coccineum]